MRCSARPGLSQASAEYHFPEWPGRTPYARLDFQHSTAQKSLLPGQDSNNALFDTTLPGLPVLNNLSIRAGLRFNGLDISAYAEQCDERTSAFVRIARHRSLRGAAGHGRH